jgi:hypothetical protein
MKVNGRKVEGPKPQVIPIPREGGDLIFKAQAVLDYTTFEQLCPIPEVPHILKKGADKATPDNEDPDYIKAMTIRGLRRFQWMVMKSLEATEGGIEWDTVKSNEPATWDNMEKELQSSGLSALELSKIYDAVMIANGMSEDLLREARERFIKGESSKDQA